MGDPKLDLSRARQGFARTEIVGRTALAIAETVFATQRHGPRDGATGRAPAWRRETASSPRFISFGQCQRAVEHLQSRLQEYLGTRVILHHGEKQGRIEIEYYGADDLQRIPQVIGFRRKANEIVEKRYGRGAPARNIRLCPVRPADMLSAASVSAGCKPAGRTDCKSMFRTARYFNPPLSWRMWNFFPRALGLAALVSVYGCSFRTAPLWEEFSGAKAFAHVQHLVEPGPRPAGSEALEKSRIYIADQLKSFG